MVTMPVGKYRGHPLDAIDERYLHWLLGLTDLHDWLRRAVEAELEDRRWARRFHKASDAGQSPGGERSAPPPGTRGVDRALALEIITRGYRLLSFERHPDRGGNLEQMKALTVAARWLRETIGRMLPEASNAG